jgi:hypothetical protein
MYDEERANAKPESHIRRLEGKAKWIVEKRSERVCVTLLFDLGYSPVVGFMDPVMKLRVS